MTGKTRLTHAGAAAPSHALRYVLQLESDPVTVLAFDEELLDMAVSGGPVVTISSWPDPAVVLGYGQPAQDVNLELCRTNHIPVLRRITGGTGVVQAGDLSVSLALPAGHPWAASITGLYDLFLAALASALSGAGVNVQRPAPQPPASRHRSPICFENWAADTLTFRGRKAVGCAQARRRDAVLVHAAIVLDLDVPLYAAVFGVRPERIRSSITALNTALSPHDLARRIAAVLGASLKTELRKADAPPVSARFLDRYTGPRWAPVAASQR